MKSSDVDILIVPGWSGSGPDHWQSRWETRLKTARRVEQADWYKPSRHVWADEIVKAVRSATRPVVLVGHSAGCSAIAFAAEHLHPGEVAGAFLVAPASEKAKGAVALVIEPFAALTAANRATLEAEGERLVRFVEPEAKAYAVRFVGE